MSIARQKEADAFIASAKKHLKTGLFKRKPDWGLAADAYEQAGRLYAEIADVEKAREAYSNASDAYDKAGSLASASLMQSRLAQFLVEHARKAGAGSSTGGSLLEGAVETYRKAAEYYALDGKHDRRAEALFKAAELTNPTAQASTLKWAAMSTADGYEEKVNRTCALLEEAVDALEPNEEDSSCCAARLPDIYRAWMLTRLRSGDMLKTVEVLERQLGIVNGSSGGTKSKGGQCARGLFTRLNQPHNVAKAGLEIIVLCLSLGDSVLARMKLDVLRGLPGFSNTKEESTARSLVEAFDQRDADMLQESLKDSTLLFITNDISRIAKKLVIKSTEAKTVLYEGDETVDNEEDLR